MIALLVIIGDKNYAVFASPLVPTWRVTHYQDSVPHMPTTVQGFYHVCREEYEDKDGSLTTCDTSCEDPNCADQWDLTELNGDDHMTYLGLYISCENVSSA